MRSIRAAGLFLAVMLAMGGPAAAVVGGAPEAGALASRAAMILNSRGGMCTGIVLAPDVLLTAGHCASGAPDFRGHYRDADGQPVLLAVAERAVHPGYDAGAVAARRRSIDLALVRLAEPLPETFRPAVLSGVPGSAGERVRLGGYGTAREGDARSTGTFRVADLSVVEPYGPSRILVWLRDGAGPGAGACLGDSGGPILRGDSVFAVTSWSSGSGRKDKASCGGFSQGVLLGPQREWIDDTLARWRRSARWE